MKKHAAVFGVGIGINGREAAAQATQRALDQLGPARPVLALVLVAQELQVTDALTGVTTLLGETPLWGFTTTSPFTSEGDQARSVVVALFTGPEFQAEVSWFPAFAQDSPSVARALLQALKQGSSPAPGAPAPRHVLLAADGINGSLTPVCSALSELPVPVSGCMAAGEVSRGKTFCIGRNQAGPGALSAAVLGGRFQIGAGLAHGWKDLGVHFRVTRTRDVWLLALDEHPAAEAYARYFGYTAREWAFPPLTDMARLYPLGVEPPRRRDTAPFFELDSASLLIRSALRVEVDGSLRMSAPVPEGAFVHLMTGEPAACLDAARLAARQAMAALEGARPILALALADAAWQTLFETRPDLLPAALKEELGETPLVGAYTFGQLARPDLAAAPVLHNQTIEVLVFGESQE